MGEPSPVRLFGLSHLVVAEGDHDAETARMTSLGWRVAIDMTGSDNPAAKRPFVAGSMAPTHRMRLLVGPPKSPAFELLAEGRPNRIGGSPAFHLAGCSGELNDWDCTLPVTIDVRARRVSDAAALWLALDLPPKETDSGAELLVGGSLAGAPLRLRLIEDAEAGAPTWLNQRGLVCLSFFCSDVRPLHRRDVTAGFETGDFFSVAPLGRPLHVFFVRGGAGEIYEFLSPMPG